MDQKIITRQEVSPIGQMVEQFIIHCSSSRGMSVTTIKTRKTHLGQFYKYCQENKLFDVGKITPSFVDDYFSFYQRTHSKSTSNTGRRILKSFLKWMTEYKELTVMRPESIRLVRTEKALPKALVVKDVLRVIQDATCPQDGLIIQILLESGIRISELVNMRVEDIHGDSILIHGKGSIERTVYISENLKREIIKFTNENKRFPYEYLVQNVYKSYGQKMTVGTARLRIQKLFKKNEITMHPHQLRHTFAVTLLKNGCDIVTIQRLLGHADIKTTQVYLNVSDDYLREQHRNYMIFT